MSFDEALRDDVADVERFRSLADETFLLLWPDERWMLTRDDSAFGRWLRAAVFDTLRDEEVRVVAVVLRGALLLLFARGVAVVLRVVCVAARLRELLASRVLPTAGVAVRLLPTFTVRPSVLLRFAGRVSTVARLALALTVSAGRVAFELLTLREVPVVVVARESPLERPLVATPRSRVSAVREATARTFDTSVTLVGRAVFRVL